MRSDYQAKNTLCLIPIFEAISINANVMTIKVEKKIFLKRNLKNINDE